MEWRNNLRRVQSMKNIPSSCDKPAWTDVGLRDRKTSVSDLVSRYQTTVTVSTVIQATAVDDGKGKSKQVVEEIKQHLVEKPETNLETLIKRNEERERSRAKVSLTRSKSMGSLQSGTVSIEALKAQFETMNSAQNQAKRNFRAANFTSPSVADVSVTKEEVKDAKKAAKEKTTHMHVGGVDANEDHVTQKVVNQTRTERRKTIGGIDFEKIAASQDEEKRRSVADFRDSSFIQTKEKLSVSVKAMSALYLSKVAPQESTHSPLKPEQDQTRKSGKGVTHIKMAEDSTSQQTTDGLPSPPSAGQEPFSGAHPQQPLASQVSKEKFYQKRQKCELRRLLKHTHPELKMLDDVVDEELAEAWSSEGSTAGETGYEGEVFSRCLIFENCGRSSQVSPYTPKTHMAEGAVERCDFNETSAVSEEPHAERAKEIIEDDKSVGFMPDLTRDCEDEMIRIDVQATRRIFESQSVNTSWPNPDNKFQGKVSTSEDEAKAVKKQKKQSEMCSQENINSKCKDVNTGLEEQPHKQVSCSCDVGKSADISGEEVSSGETFSVDETTRFTDSERLAETIKTSAALLQNNPFISTNIEREHSYVHMAKTQIPDRGTGAAEDYLTANVKNRTHLFESMPFDKIRHQNKDEIETMVENIKETLNFLYSVKAIYSAGSIIEVNETMIAKKAKFTLSESGPEIKYDEVAEGGAQNFIVQLLPRVNLKHQLTYLKEDSKGFIEAVVVNVPVHQHQFNTSKDTELKTANVVQLIEDILNQDNSLRKGVIIQEDVNNRANVIVYSLYNYFDEEDVKRYSPPQGAESDQSEVLRGDRNGETRKGVSESTTSSHLETSQDQGSVRPEIKMKGNVKLFKSCIEKGDLEYLKTLQAEPTVQEQDMELQHEQRADQTEESTLEWVPVDVKRIKSMFSGDQSQIEAKKNISDNRAPSATISHAFTGQNELLGKSQSFTECTSGVISNIQKENTFTECSGQAQEDIGNLTQLHLDPQDDDSVHQAELVEVIDDSDEIFNLQSAIQSLQQATIEAKSLCHSLEEKQKILTQEPPEEPPLSVTADNMEQSRTEITQNRTELSQKNEDRLAFNFTPGHKSDCKHKNIEPCHEDTNTTTVQSTEMCGKEGQKGTEVVQKPTIIVSANSSEIAKQEDEEVVFEGKIRAALESLKGSNVNVMTGDFKAAMIYRNSSKPHQERSQNVAFVQKPNTEEPEGQSTQVQLRQEVAAANAEHPDQTGTLNKPATCVISEKNKRPVGPKPAIPPKPEHLKVKERNIQSTKMKNPEGTQTKTVRPTETAPQVPQQLPKTSVSCKDEHKQDLFKINRGLTADSVDCQRNEPLSQTAQTSREAEAKYQVQGSAVTSECDDKHKHIITGQQDMKVTGEQRNHQDLPVKDSINETDEEHVDFQKARQKFGGKKKIKIAPVKPKRVKIAQPCGESVSAHADPKATETITNPSINICGQMSVSKYKQEKEKKPDGKVEMREKKGRTETEDERRQRLSVHMDEIMRGNITTAMEIFDNLRKQEELQSILSRVEEIEEDTSNVDVRSLRRVFEDVPDWVVSSDDEKPKKVKAEDKALPLLRESTESKSSMAHVFGDLERASEEIMNLKEQTLARLVDIEQAIKKALFSVSTLKSESDIAGLSCLFRESLGDVQESPSSGNISKISIESSRTKAQGGAKTKGSTAKPTGQSTEVAKQRSSPPSSPAFISIQSAARKKDKRGASPPETSICPTCKESPKLEEKFRTTKTLTCNSPAQNRRRDPRKEGQKQSTCSPVKPHRELSVLEVQTDREGNSILGTKTVTENYERTDNFGNRFYSTKTSTVITTQPETTTTSTTSQAVISPMTYQLPINQINTLIPK